MVKQGSILKKKSFWLLLALVSTLLYPFESTVIPSRNVVVMTKDRKAVQGARVRQIWQNYSIESVGHEEDLLTREDGRVSFPHRKIRASLLRRAFWPVANIMGQGVHASFGIHTDMFYLKGADQKPVLSKNVDIYPEDTVFTVEPN
jgi:hypothetical protein